MQNFIFNNNVLKSPQSIRRYTILFLIQITAAVAQNETFH